MWMNVIIIMEMWIAGEVVLIKMECLECCMVSSGVEVDLWRRPVCRGSCSLF